MGKRLVVDVILNRVDSDKFPNTITDVIDAPGQFAVVHNGAINRVSISQETFTAIEMELEHRTDTEVLYFRNSHYGTGKPLYQINDHYFSK
jgi:N-acetylmuramoyl-L-alanine amidase